MLHRPLSPPCGVRGIHAKQISMIQETPILHLPLHIAYQDAHYVAVHKPANLLVHKTQISSDKVALLQLLRNQVGQHVYPIHRLDRPTSGIILFGLHSEAVEKIKPQFTNHSIIKTYWAIVRGFTEPQGHIDYALQEEPDKPMQSAITNYQTLHSVEVAAAVGRYATARYSWIEVKPLTGRMHQIRKHMSHLRHPIVGDIVYGDRAHNRFWQNDLGLKRLLLLAKSITWQHPYNEETITSECLLDADWQIVTDYFLRRADLRLLKNAIATKTIATIP